MNATSPAARLGLLITRSLLHIGSGDADGDIDQPVVRNAVTGHPCVPDE